MASRAQRLYDRVVLRVIASLAVLAAGCGLADFDISQPIPEQRVGGSNLPVPPVLSGLFPIPLSLDLAAEIRKQTTGPIDAVTLKRLGLSITDTARPQGDEDDWSFVEEIRVFVRGREGSSLPRVEIASVADPGAVTELVFEVEGGVNLKPYVDEGAVVESEARGVVPADDVSYDGRAVFTVHPL
jgi:hypothetical protein